MKITPKIQTETKDKKITRLTDQVETMRALLERSVLYLEHPDIVSMDFACPTEPLAKFIRDYLRKI